MAKQRGQYMPKSTSRDGAIGAWLRDNLLAPAGVVLAVVALLQSCTSNRIANDALEQTRTQTGLAQSEQSRATADYPCLRLELVKSYECDRGNDPQRAVLRFEFQVVSDQAGEASDIDLTVGVSNLLISAKDDRTSSFFSGQRVLARRFGSLYDVGANTVLRGRVNSEQYGIVRILYQLRWGYGSPIKRGVTVGEYTYVSSRVWPRVYRVAETIPDGGPTPDSWSLVSGGFRRENGGSIRWLDGASGRIRVSRSETAKLDRLHYADEASEATAPKAKVVSRPYPTLIIRYLPGQTSAQATRMNDGTPVDVLARVGEWARVAGADVNGVQAKGWCPLRCLSYITCEQRKLPVGDAFEGYTLLRRAMWSSVRELRGDVLR